MPRVSVQFTVYPGQQERGEIEVVRLGAPMSRGGGATRVRVNNAPMIATATKLGDGVEVRLYNMMQSEVLVFLSAGEAEALAEELLTQLHGPSEAVEARVARLERKWAATIRILEQEPLLRADLRGAIEAEVEADEEAEDGIQGS